MRQTVWVVAGVLLALVALAGAALIGGILGFLAGTAGGAAPGIAGLPERQISGEGPDKIVVIRIVGPITHEGSAGLVFLASGASSRAIVRQLDAVRRDEAAKAVILELNTPGGSIVASDEVHQKIQEVRRAGKPVVALMTETAASGGYYIAAAADHIVADPTTITGSIGVIVALPNIEELSRKIGIRTVVFKSGDFKDIGNPNRPVSAAERAIFKRLIDEAYTRFVDVVARGRRMERAKVLRLADGRIYTGLQARRLGLVDSLGHLPEAVSVAMQRAGLKAARVVEYEAEGLLRSLLGLSVHRLQAWLWGAGNLSPEWRQPFSLQFLMLP